MGDPKHARKKYTSPRKRWDKTRVDREKKIIETYGLKNKRELRMAETILRNKRENSRKLLALPLERRVKREKELLESLATLGLLKGKCSLDDVLSLSVGELLERRLQTIVWRKNLAKTIKQARQFITHGHIAINGKKVGSPGYLVKANEADKINYFKTPLQLEPKKKKEETKEEKLGKEEKTKGEAGEIEKEGEEALEEIEEEKEEAIE